MEFRGDLTLGSVPLFCLQNGGMLPRSVEQGGGFCIIRNEREMSRIWDYIESNPARWDDDDENPRNW
jgi:hypothetical protein